MLLRFDQATPDELPVVLDVLDEAAAWLKDRRIKQWPERFGGVDDWRLARIASYVRDGKTWLARVGSEVAATFTIGGADPDYADGWPDGPDTGLYIFRMAVRRDWAGNDLGGRILDWASVRAADDGQSWLRLDCHRENYDLQRYYEERGFVRVNTLVRTILDGPGPGEGELYTRGSGALYQRPAGSIQIGEKRAEGNKLGDRYDPTGEAAKWHEAADVVSSMRGQKIPGDDLGIWDAALTQAARELENRARAVRQSNGMYFRVISGPGAESRAGEG